MQPLLDLFQHFPLSFVAVVFTLGLVVGSFLNVVIYRLPIMMERSWRQECRAFLQLSGSDEPGEPQFDLMMPASHCPVCQASVKPYQNIPVVSYLLLKGRCAHCRSPIAVRYPLVELLSGILSAAVAWQFGLGSACGFALLLTWALIAASFIDIDRQLLPDNIVLPMLWLGLLLSVWPVFVDSRASIVGAAAGYLSLWLVYQVFRLVTGKEGMGFGDFKLLALFGAWLGWEALPMIVLLSSLVGTVFGLAQIALQRLEFGKPMPFGPYLAAAGWLVLVWGGELKLWYFQAVGL